MYCRRCGTPLHLGAVICPECGARQRRQPSSVRCANCHGRVPLALSVCPHCGRDVRPAGPRWGLWLATAIVIVLVVLWSLGTLPIERAGQKIVGIKTKISGLVQVLGPAPTTEPAATTARLIARTTPVASPAPSAGEEQPVVAPQAEPSSDAEEAESPAAEPSPAEAGLAARVGTPAVGTQTVTDVPMLAPTASPTASPTATPTLPPTATATPVPPTATVPPPAATATPAVGSAANRYRIQSGDTLSGIAQRFNVSLEALLAANRLTVNATLRIGQELVIPGAGAPTATPKPRATPTPLPSTPTPAPYLAAPVLTDPADGASYGGDTAQILLEWEPVTGMTADDSYLITVNWTHLGAPQNYFWYAPSTASTQRVPLQLWQEADQLPARKYQWSVRAVHLTTDGQGGELVIPLSPASQTRTFYWN